MSRAQTAALAALLAAGLWLCAAPAALAKSGDAACMWNAVPQAQRDAFLTAYAEKGPSVAGMLTEAAPAAAAACHIEGKESWLIADTMISAALKDASAKVLHDAYGVDEARLEAAWNELDPAAREQFAKDAAAFSEKPEGTNPGHDLFEQVFKRLGLSDPAASLQLNIYFMAKVVAPYDDGKL